MADMERILAALDKFKGYTVDEIRGARVSRGCAVGPTGGLMVDDVLWIRSCGLPVVRMAEALGVTRHVVARCLARQTYKWVR